MSTVWAANRLMFNRFEVASLLNLSLRTVDNHLASGRLSSVKIGKRRLVSRDTLLNLAGDAIRGKLAI